MSFLSDEQDKVPNFRQWTKATGNEVDEIEGFMLSNSGEWIIINCLHSVAFVSFKSKIGQQLWEAIKPFKGKAQGLFLKKSAGKLGFSIEISENQGYWEWDGKFLNFDPDYQIGKGENKMADLWARMTGEETTEEAKKPTKRATSTNPKA